MAKQTLIWTCLPNGMTDDEKHLRVSVMVSPKLDADGGLEELAGFPEWLDWPRTLNDAVFVFYADGQVVGKTMVRDVAGATRHDSTLGIPDSNVWRALFRKDFYVESYNVQRDVSDLLDSKILSYSATDVHDLVKEMYVDLAARCNEHLPRIGRDLIDNNLWKELINSVQQVDRWGNKKLRTDLLPEYIQTGDPISPDTKHPIGRRFATLGTLLSDAVGLSRGTALERKVHHLARFELFQTPPLRPKKIEEVTRDDDPAISEMVDAFERPPVPSERDLARSMHFHRAVAAMNNYPTLLRHLGLVVDFVLNRDLMREGDSIALEVMVEFPEPLPTPLTAMDANPITYANHRNNQFFTASRPHLNSNQALRINQGLLDIYTRPDRFAMLQADVDSAVLKLMNFARTLGKYDVQQGEDSAILKDDVTRQEKQLGAPSLRTAGISLVRKERANALKARFNANKQQLADAQSPQGMSLWAEDLVRGYRIDVWDAKVGFWRSLCRRQARYDLAGGRISLSPLPGEEEATVQLAATRSPDETYNRDILYLHESMVAWGGWSLAAPQPGKAIGNDVDRGGEKPEFTEAAGPVEGLDFQSTFTALPGSLPRLRYGRRYALRARAVDLAGNSLPPREKSFGIENPENEAQPFLRFESLAAPILALPDAAGNPAPPGYGESMYRLAIRSFNNQFDDSSPSAESCSRYAVPPQSTVHEAELHGMLDRAGVVNAATFAMLALEKDRDANDREAALITHQFALKGPLDREDERVKTTYPVWREGRTMTYLPDPMAQIVSAWFIDHPGIDARDTLSVPLYRNGAQWPEAEPFRVDLYEDLANPLAPPFYDEGTHTLRIPLAKGERAKLRLTMRIGKSDLFERMGLWQWLDPAIQQKIERATLEGRSWLFTPWQEVELVHAVQRPLIRPSIPALEIGMRDPGATFALPRFHAEVSLKSTDRLDLLAQWHEPVDPPLEDDKACNDLAFQIKVTSAKDYVADMGAMRDHSLPDEEQLGPNVIGINSIRMDLKAVKRHEFGDTRYRRIEYRLKATSRYREYLPPELLLAPFPPVADETPAQVDTHIALEGPPTVGWIPNSAPPPAPEVLYVVPTFGWSRTAGEDGAQHSWRRGGGLRVYLNRPWNASGYGEMLAVVLPVAGYNQDPAKESTGNYKKMVTQWGSDPLWTSPALSGVAPRISNFPRARLAPDVTGKWLPPGALPSEADQQPGAFETSFSRNGANIEIAPHDVFFDDDRQLWYCDIEIDHGDSYWPFVRLALARYQPISVHGVHLSEIVMADFMQLTADRWATVRPGAHPGTYEVSLLGSSYTESAGAWEVRALDPLIGAVTSLRPARFAAGTVAEVWLERLNPGLGEDFGWQRIAQGIPTSPAAVDARLPHLQEQKRSISKFDNLRFKVQRNAPFSSQVSNSTLLNPELIERWFKPKPLWEGSVHSPGDSSRYRIVIAEYEEYPVDGEMPYEVIPTNIGRRLVFVEHIEVG